MENARNTDETESSEARIARLERMVELLTESLKQQQQNQKLPPPPPPPVKVERNNDDVIALIQKFNKMKPPEFLGGIEPLKVEAWIMETEKIFEVFPCTDEHKVLLATFTLKEKARRWWMLVRDENRDLTWDRFKEIFYEKYFSQCIRDRKVSEFEQLKQGDMTVAEYEAKFTELARYAPHMVDTDYKKARKFEGGLTIEVLHRVNILKLVKYVDVLDRALMFEANIAALKMSKPTTTTEGESKKIKKQKMEMVSESMASVNKKSNLRTFGNTSRGNNGNNEAPTCRECGKQHWGNCHRLSGACFKCGQKGHLAKCCPQAHPNNERPVTNRFESAMTSRMNVIATEERSNLRQGKVYTLVSENMQNIETANAGERPEN